MIGALPQVEEALETFMTIIGGSGVHYRGFRCQFRVGQGPIVGGSGAWG